MEQSKSAASARPLRLPGAALAVRVNVHDTPGPDGQIGGTPHVHLASTESYFVTAGSGAVEIIDHRGWSRLELRLGSMLVFHPGTIHRLINPQGDLQLLVTMQSGLPERGDNVVCFVPELMASDEVFDAA